ncbi:MAG: metal-dependent hydrolase [Symploca sp. SIO2E9]|nr:metal-dependent hydrolase [Symploca sp. SIO2E9]
MPSPIAHSVSGYVLAKFLPLEEGINHGRRRWDVQIFYPVFVAAAADFDFIPQLITEGNYHRGLTHSLTFAIGFSAVVGLIFSYLWKFSYKQVFLWTLLLYSSHLCLDFFSEGRGIKLFFPFTDSFFKSPLTIFPGVHHSRGLWDYSHIIPLVFESIYSVLLFLLVWWRRVISLRRQGMSNKYQDKKIDIFSGKIK